MPQPHWSRFTALIATLVVAVAAGGCTSFRDYFGHGLKVGPNYCQPDAPVSEHWIDDSEVHACDSPEILSHWWTIFNDPKLNELVQCAYRQNLTLRQAGCRILQARATRDIAIGKLFPQQQIMRGSYARNAAAVGARSSEGFGIERYSDSWSYGFNLNWELDFWGRFRRAIASTEASLEASMADYDFVLVTLLGDVATNYLTIRTSEVRIALLRVNAKLQEKVVTGYLQPRVDVGETERLDLEQAISLLKQTEAGIPQLEVTKRQAENALCVLLGMPTVDLTKMLEDEQLKLWETSLMRMLEAEQSVTGARLKKMLRTVPIPSPPQDPDWKLIVDIPANLVRRRPDVRKAERQAAAQAEQIGIAETDLYPAFYINGNFGYAAENFPDLFRNTAFNGSLGPSFQWNLLNYGRIVNNVHYQDAKFQELVLVYQNTVLQANQEVENGLVTFLRSQQRSNLLRESAIAAEEARRIALKQYKEGGVPNKAGTGDFNRYATIEQNLVTQMDALAQARGQIAQGLIQVYRALGGGWEIGLGEGQEQPPLPDLNAAPNGSPPEAPPHLEAVPAPIPDAPAVPKEPDAPKKPAASKSPATPNRSETAREPIYAKQMDFPKEPGAGKDINVLREPEGAKGPAALKDTDAGKALPSLAEPALHRQSSPATQSPPSSPTAGGGSAK
jgi:outer membrane protein TolC